MRFKRKTDARSAEDPGGILENLVYAGFVLESWHIQECFQELKRLPGRRIYG